jgi:hypothetical protein
VKSSIYDAIVEGVSRVENHRVHKVLILKIKLNAGRVEKTMDRTNKPPAAEKALFQCPPRK